MRNSKSYGDGIPFVVWAVFWLLGGVIPIVLTGYDVLHPFIDRVVGRDFTNLWTAGKLVWAGRAACAFDVNCFRIAEYNYVNLLGLQNYSYPPPALFVAAPFALLPYYGALALWTVIGIAFFVWCARPYLPKEFPPLLAAFTSAGAFNIWNGHYGFLLGGLWLLFYRDLERKPTYSGIFAGLLTLKPHLGLMIAASIFRRRRAVIVAVLTVVALFAASLVAFGPDPWNWFVFATTTTQDQILTRTSHEFYFRMMPSAYVGFGRANVGFAAQVVFATAATGLLVRYRRWDAFSAATATFLIVPYVFNYDMTVACLGFAILLFERWGSLGKTDRGWLVLAFFSPELTYYAGFLVPPILLATLNLQLKAAPESAVSAKMRSPEVGSLAGDAAAT